MHKQFILTSLLITTFFIACNSHNDGRYDDTSSTRPMSGVGRSDMNNHPTPNPALDTNINQPATTGSAPTQMVPTPESSNNTIGNDSTASPNR